jgi:hypothetical protein
MVGGNWSNIIQSLNRLPKHTMREKDKNGLVCRSSYKATNAKNRAVLKREWLQTQQMSFLISLARLS